MKRKLTVKPTVVDGIIDDLVYAPWLIYMRFLRADGDESGGAITRRSFAIAEVLDRNGPLPLSEIGRRLLISRPQMTYLVDRLINMGMAERSVDGKDRRVVNLTLTRKGRAALELHRRLLKKRVAIKLARLTPAELEDLAVSLRKIRDIGLRLE